MLPMATFRQLALVFNPRSGNVCVPGQSYYANFLNNVYSLQGMGGDWLADESSQDIIKLMGCFNTNDMSEDGRFVYEYLINVLIQDCNRDMWVLMLLN